MAKKKKGAAEEDGAKPKKDKKKKIIVVVVALAAAWKFGLLPIGGAKAAEGATTTTEMAPGDAVAVGEAMVVNLSDAGGVRYARVGMAIVLPGHAEAHADTETTEAATEATTRRGRSGTTETTATHEAETTTVSATTAATDTTGHEAAALGGLSGRPVAVMIPRSAAAEDPAKVLAAKFPRLRAAAIEIIRTYSATELLSPEGPQNLEDELSDAAYEIYGHDEIYGVIITELIVQ